MIFATIETKIPNLLFQNPKFSLKPKPVGTEFDINTANEITQAKEDAINFIASRPEFGLSDKQELALLDCFFGFGVIETNYSDEPHMNPYINLGVDEGPYDCIYCKQIPFDRFRAAPSANWDLSEGKWFGYYEFIPYNRLQKFHDKLKFPDRPFSDTDEAVYSDEKTGKIVVAAEAKDVVGPAGTVKVWKIWDFEYGKFIMLADEGTTEENKLLEYEDFDYSPLSFLRLIKRRKGWYPYPPIWNWVSPQDEINDIRQAQRLHRKRFSRKYTALVGAFENEEELDKFIYGPDGTIVKVNRPDAIQAVQDAPVDPVAAESLVVSYDDFNRISGTSDERRGLQQASTGNRTTATQANITNQASQVRDSKDSTNVANFMCCIARHILKAARQVKKEFWVASKLPSEGVMQELEPTQYTYKKINKKHLADMDYDMDISVSSISPINQQQDKQAFMEFLALITQYEILAFSPALLREAAYRVGYKNEAVLNQFQQMAQLAAIGRMAQMKQQVGMIGQGGVQPTPPGQLPQQQIDQSTPPDNQSIMNMIFNKAGVQ